jgi:hypothetical protein
VPRQIHPRPAQLPLVLIMLHSPIMHPLRKRGCWRQLVILTPKIRSAVPLRIHALRILTFLLVYVAALPCRAQDKVAILYDAFGESKGLTSVRVAKSAAHGVDER